MREFLAAACFAFCGLVAHGQQAPGPVTLFPGGFRPSTGDFSITFGFSDLRIVPDTAREPKREIVAPRSASTATEWASAVGTTARLEVCCIDRKKEMPDAPTARFRRGGPVKLPPINGMPDGTLAVARLWVSNLTARPVTTTMTVAIAPQGSLSALAFEKHAFFVEGRPIFVSDTPSRGAILAESSFAARSLIPKDHAHVESAAGECRGEMIFDLTLAAGETRALGFICPVRLPAGNGPDLDFYRALTVEKLFAESEERTEF